MLAPVSSSFLYTRSRHYRVWRVHLCQWLCTGSVKRNTQTTDWTTVSMPLPWHRLLLWKISQSQWPLMVASQICRVYQRAHGKIFWLNIMQSMGQVFTKLAKQPGCPMKTRMNLVIKSVEPVFTVFSMGSQENKTQDCLTFSCSTQLCMKFQLLIKLKCWKIQTLKCIFHANKCLGAW